MFKTDYAMSTQSKQTYHCGAKYRIMVEFRSCFGEL